MARLLKIAKEIQPIPPQLQRIMDAEHFSQPHTSRQGILEFIKTSSNLKNAAQEVSSNLLEKIIAAVKDAEKQIDKEDEELERNRSLLASIFQKRTILFVGAGFSLENAASNYRLSSEDIRASIVKRIASRETGHDPGRLEEFSLPELSQIFINQFGENEFTDAISELCRNKLPRTPLPHHRTLARLGTFDLIVTTNWDRLIETAFGENNRKLTVIHNDDAFIHLAEPGAKLVKLHGDYDPDSSAQPWAEPPRVSRDQIEQFWVDNPKLGMYIKAQMAVREVVVVGLDIRDTTLASLLREHHQRTGKIVYNVNLDSYSSVSIPRERCGLIKSSADHFLSAIAAFESLGNGASGVAIRGAPERTGPSGHWAKHDCTLANELLGKYPNLRLAQVVGARAKLDDDSTGKDTVAACAARMLAHLFAPRVGNLSKRLTVGCGRTLGRVVDYIDYRNEHFDGLEVYGAAVPFSDVSQHASPMSHVASIAQRFFAHSNRDVRGYLCTMPASFASVVMSDDLRALWERIYSLLAAEHSQNTQHQVSRYRASASTIEPLQQADRCSPTGRGIVTNYLSEAEKADVFLLSIGMSGCDGTAMDGFALSCWRNLCRVVDSHQDERLRTVNRYIKAIDDKYAPCGDLLYQFIVTSGVPVSADNSISILDEASAIGCIREGLDARQNNRRKGISPSFAAFCASLLTYMMPISTNALLAAKKPNKEVVIVGRAEERAPAMHAALKAGIGTVLVIDAELAESLLSVQS